MASASRRSLVLAGILLLTTALVWAEAPPAASDDGKSTTPAAKEPGAVFLTQEKYKELLDQIAALKRQAGLQKETPSSCKLSGRVDGDLVRLTAEFEFRTAEPRALVSLGCQKAQLSAAALDDGRLPILPPPGEDGFVVQVDTPGQHRLQLEMELPITAKGTDRSFDLNLPRAAINVLEQFDVSGSVSELRITSVEDKRQFQQVVPTKTLNSKNEQRRALALGAVSRLEVAWKVAAAPLSGAAIREARGQVEVRVDEHSVTTEVDLTLKLRTGQTDQWRILAPMQQGPTPTTIEFKGPADERPPTVTPPTDPKNPVWQIKGEPTSKPIQLSIRIRQPRSNKLIPVGPFAVLDAERQSGNILITAPANVRLRYHPRGDISQCEIPEDRRQDTNVVASFNYYSLPMPARPGQPALAPLDLEIEAVQGVIETRVLHTLLLNADGWHITRRIEVTPVRTTVDHLAVEFPPGYQLVKPPSSLLVESVETEELDDQRRQALIKLVQKQLPNRMFHLTLEGLIPVPKEVEQIPAGRLRRQAVGLPHPVETQDRGGEVTASVREGLELLAPESGSEVARPGSRPHTWNTDRSPRQVDLSWREHRPDLLVNATVDLTLTDRVARVRHQLHIPAAPNSTTGSASRAPLLLRIPPALAGRVVVEEDYKLAPLDETRTVWTVTLPQPDEKDATLKKNSTITLEYSFPLPEPDRDEHWRPFTIPLVKADQATGGTTKVWVWSEPGVAVQLVSGSDRWEELQTELVAQHPGRLPSLVLRSSSLTIPELSLKQEPAEVPPTVVERVLIEVLVGDWGYQSYRARFRITRLTMRTLEIELPAPPAQINAAVLFDNRRLPLKTVDDNGTETELGRIVRLQVDPALYQGKPAVLDVQYQLLIGREGHRPLRLQTTFQPPVLRGRVFVWEKLWGLRLPATWVPLHLGEGTTPEQRWGLRGWFLGPRPALTGAELESWFTGSELVEGADRGDLSLVCRQAELRPVVLVHVPQQAWLLACSLTVFAAGFILYFAPLPRGRFWVIVLALGALVVAIAVWWPQALPFVVYGSEPGLVILGLVFIYAWVRQRRYRRQVVFMPGFTHLKTGSSLVRNKGSERGRREPSTVDAAPSNSGPTP
jgi:hypothetical protein